MMQFLANTMKRLGIGDQDSIPESPNSPGVTSMDAPLSHMKIDGKYNYSTLEYPSDIQSRTDLGHYMMFYVNIPLKSSYSRTSSFGGKEMVAESNRKDAGMTEKIGGDPAQMAILSGTSHSRGAGTAGTLGNGGKSWKPGETDKVVHRQKLEGALPSQTTRTNDAIILYMPSEITSAQAADYKSSEVGGGVGAGIKVLNEARSLGLTSSKGISKMLQGFAEIGATQIERGAGVAAGAALQGNIMGAYDKLNNQAQNQFLETMFQGIGFRKFSYTFQFRPKNPKEVISAQQIIKTFKFHMAPEVPKGNAMGRFFVVPAEFDIFYMFRGEENEWINKIATSVLVNCDVNYAPNGYQTFRPMEGRKGAPPTEIDMKLDFMETKIITKAEVLAGY